MLFPLSLELLEENDIFIEILTLLAIKNPELIKRNYITYIFACIRVGNIAISYYYEGTHCTRHIQNRTLPMDVPNQNNFKEWSQQKILIRPNSRTKFALL